MMRISEWLKDKGHEPRDGALRIGDAMGISALEATSRYPASRRAGASQQFSVVGMVIAEWHRLIADVSRTFARKRIHRAAMRCRQSRVSRDATEYAKAEAS